MIQNLLYNLLGTLFLKAYKMYLMRDLYNIAISDG